MRLAQAIVMAGYALDRLLSLLSIDHPARVLIGEAREKIVEACRLCDERGDLK